MNTPETTPGTPAASSSNSASVSPQLGKAMRQGLVRPVDDLRSSMRTLERRFESGDPRGQELGRALAQVEQLGRSVQELLDFAYLPKVQVLDCTIDEILYSARFLIPRPLWSRLLVAREKNMASLRVDGPVLARSIARLVEGAAPHATEGVLLNVYGSRGATVFTITFRGRADSFGDAMGLGHTIASRDLSVIGCPMTDSTSSAGDTSICIRVPVADTAAEGCAA
ncbi:MAG: hypothetical protein P1V81_11095 [Planctomycetota bacterium]|nr:hypothetical protein [Planctomycetota bacterium]